MFKKMKKFVMEKVEKVEKAFAPMLAAGAAMGIVPTAYADGATDAMQKIINLVYTMFKYIGIVLALWGIGSLIMAFKNEDADSKTRAIMSLIVGVALVTLQALTKDLVKGLLNENVASKI